MHSNGQGRVKGGDEAVAKIGSGCQIRIDIEELNQGGSVGEEV